MNRSGTDFYQTSASKAYICKRTFFGNYPKLQSTGEVLPFEIMMQTRITTLALDNRISNFSITFSLRVNAAIRYS